MKQTWIWAVLVAVALAAGFFGGQMTRGGEAVSEELQTRVAKLEEKISSLEKQLTARPAAGGLKIAYIHAEKVFQDYRKTTEAVQKFRAEAERRQQEFRGIQDRFRKGLLSEDEFQRESARIQQEMQRLDLELTTQIQGEMLKVIERIAAERNFDWVTQRKDVVLYAKPGVLEDITYDVLKILNE
ncbi:OmpH family outer membrane protein [Candidatus Acetothermia bacterium]|jgi:Skp family chaperone for outer membrane proteins|nr:OmpH family outer membrane protein [Candidatus Acetothermia bacterium]MCI2432606.1 OmpH family outer membrane protein [Candidatus Acetothermia bacterium]MCI2436643.1 OmpH family outer membrane protein [Candidatus Acetothermia bacterium]